MINKALKTLNETRFNRLILVWSCPATNMICVRDKMTGHSKIITLRG